MLSKKFKYLLILTITTVLALGVFIRLGLSKAEMKTSVLPQESKSVQKVIEAKVQRAFEEKVQEIIGTKKPLVPNDSYGRMLIEAKKTMAVAKASSGLFNAYKLRAQAFESFLMHPEAQDFIASVYSGPLEGVPWEELGMSQAEWRFYGTKLVGYLASLGQLDLANTIVNTLSNRLKNDKKLDDDKGFVADFTDTVWEVLENTDADEFESVSQILISHMIPFEELKPNTSHHLINTFFHRCMSIHKHNAHMCLETIQGLMGSTS